MCNQISSDKPVSLKEEDRFQRYDFSKRIAERIINAENNDSIVIGVYGAWGEGKTSVINFIENELVKNNSIITIKFNPWRFTDESTLLITFFNCLAREIKKSFNEKNRNLTKPNLINRIRLKWEEKKAPLVTNKEKIGELIEKYGSIVSGYNAGAGVANIGKSMSSVSIDTLKERFESLLIKSNKKIVVFIDDIDRLDKQEIHSIFRLVKLTANFQNTYYILSFDQEMVASAIGERFGSGDKNSGLNFLEKIIQVPLTIPVSQPDSLKQYCFELIEKTIESNKVMLTTDEVRRFVSEFSENVLIKLKTPRLAVQSLASESF
jgi:predicted KAP-like P-loop ATPase